MSIRRGVNSKKKSSDEVSIQKLASTPLKQSRQDLSPMQYDKIRTQMKQLLKENTKLKQQNLQLKQQMMLNKIQLQNMKLLNEQIQFQCQEKIQAIQHKEQNTFKFTKNIRKKGSINMECFKRQQTEADQDYFQEVPINIKSRLISASIQLHSKKKNNENRDINAPFLKQKKLVDNFTKPSSKISEKSTEVNFNRKQQIMNKYKSYLNSQSQLSLNNSELF